MNVSLAVLYGGLSGLRLTSEQDRRIAARTTPHVGIWKLLPSEQHSSLNFTIREILA